MSKWSKEKAWEWYNSRPWIRGCNFMGSDCANRVDQWQEYGFEEKLQTAKRELALAAETGFNSVRIIVDFDVWNQEHDGFMKRFDRYLTEIHKNGMETMIVLINGCHVPKEFYAPAKMGPQPFCNGYHGNKIVSPHARRDEECFYPTDDPELAKKHYAMVEEILKEYKNDERVLAWNLFNEPGNGKKDPTSTLETLDRLMEISWSVRPMQPLMIDVWDDLMSENIESTENPCNLRAAEVSDIISFHEYGSFERTIYMIDKLKKHGRPMMCTEWLHRIYGNTLEELFPLFFLENIGSYNWGFVAGKYQTYEPWESLWQEYGQDKAKDWDYTKWQHDLYRPSLRPYNPKEIELIKRICRYADDKFNRK